MEGLIPVQIKVRQAANQVLVLAQATPIQDLQEEDQDQQEIQLLEAHQDQDQVLVEVQQDQDPVLVQVQQDQDPLVQLVAQAHRKHQRQMNQTTLASPKGWEKPE